MWGLLGREREKRVETRSKLVGPMEFCKNTQNNQSNLCPSTIKHLPRQPAGGPPLLETASNELKCAISVFAQN
jgi:hypothetical protein